MQSVSDIIADLQAPVKSFRLFALERAIAHGSGEVLLRALEDYRKTERDDECLWLLPHALEAVKNRAGGQGSTGQTRAMLPVPIDQIPERYRTGSPADRLKLVLGVIPDSVEQLMTWATEVIATERDPALLSQLIRVFGRNWPKNRLSLLIKKLSSPSVSVRCAAIEALAAVDPMQLADCLPILVQDDDPRVFAGVVKFMAKLNPEAARGYLEQGFRSGDPGRKLEMLRVSVVLPFEIVKQPLLIFLSLERDPNLMEKAGLVLQVNPDPEIPIRLLELIVKADPHRAALLTRLFEAACHVIRDSNILGDTFSSYLSRIQEAVRKRTALQRVRIALSDLTSPDETDRIESEAVLAEPASAPLVQEAIAGTTIATSPETQAHIEQIQEQASVPVGPVLDAGWFNENRFLELSVKEQSRLIAGLQTPDLAVVTTALRFIMDSPRADNRIKAVALRAAIRFGVAEFVTLARRWVLGTDEALTIAALEYLGHFTPEQTLDILGRFHRSTSVRIQTAAMKILATCDPKQAVSMGMAILKNPDSRMRNAGLSCLMSLDFSLVREPLVDHLGATRDSDLLEGALALFRHNPDPENLFQLYRLQRTFSGDQAGKIEAVMQETIALIKELHLMQPERLSAMIGGFAGRWQRVQESKALPVSRSQTYAHLAREAGESVFILLRNTIVSHPRLSGMTFAIALLCLWLVGGWLRSETQTRSSAHRAVLAEPVEIVATVTDLFPETDEIMLVSVERTMFRLVQSNDSRTLKVGDRVKATVKPFRTTEDWISARFLTVQKQ